MKIDLHTHSYLSFDGKDSVDALLRMAQKNGLDGLAITDHDEIEASLEAETKSSEYGILAIPGTEVTSAVGHVLAIGVRECIEPGLSFQETIDQIHKMDGIAVVPHPFQKIRNGVGMKIPRNVLSKADAIEIYNSRLFTGRGNRNARKFAEEYNLPVTAGSDAHIASMVGRAGIRIETDENTVEGVIDAIRNGKTEVWGRRTPRSISFFQASAGVGRKIKNRVKKIKY